MRFEAADATGYPAEDHELICFFDALHDLGDPVGAAAHARQALAPGGTLMLVEPLAFDDLATNLANNPIAAMNYSASTFCASRTRCPSQSGSASARRQASRGCERCWPRPASDTSDAPRKAPSPRCWRRARSTAIGRGRGANPASPPRLRQIVGRPSIRS